MIYQIQMNYKHNTEWQKTRHELNANDTKGTSHKNSTLSTSQFTTICVNLFRFCYGDIDFMIHVDNNYFDYKGNT